MHTIQLAPIDWAIIGLYFVAIIGIGLYLRRFTTTGEDFFLAGRRNSSWVAGLAFLSANLGALEILGWTGGTMKYGMLVSQFYWIGAIPAMLFLGLYMMPFYYSSKIHSVPGYLLLRFDERSRLLNAFSFAVMTLLMSGINLYLMALVFNVLLGWGWNVSMWVSAAAIACYITLGGLMSAIFTEIVQFFLIWAGLFLVSVLGVMEMGGVEQVFAGLPPAMASLWATTGDSSQNAMGVTWPGIVMGLGFVLSFGYWTTDFLVVQRAFSSKDLRSARLTPITASFFKMALPFIVVVAGLVAYKLAARGDGSFVMPADPMDASKTWYDAALPLLIVRYYPEGLVGLGITALLAGFMAGQAGNVSAFNTVFTYDIYRAVIKKDATDAHLLKVGRVMTIVGILLSIGTAYLAMQFNAIMDYIQAIFSWVNAPLFATMLLGMFWKRTTSTAAFYGLIAGMIASFSIFLGFKLKAISPELAHTLTFADNPSDMTRNLWQAIWAWVVCFGVTVALTFVTKPKTDAELVGLVKGLTPDTDDSQVAWYGRPAVWAAASFAVLVALNVYFW
ncbi:MAG: sodium:solute symporter family protein [Myxococcota bacterium]